MGCVLLPSLPVTEPHPWGLLGSVSGSLLSPRQVLLLSLAFVCPAHLNPCIFRVFLKAVSCISFFLGAFIMLTPWEFCFEILNYFLLPIPPQKIQRMLFYVCWQRSLLRDSPRYSQGLGPVGWCSLYLSLEMSCQLIISIWQGPLYLVRKSGGK